MEFNKTDITLRQYIILNKRTLLYALKITSIVLTICVLGLTMFMKYSLQIEEDPVIVFLGGELFAYSLAVFVTVLSILSGFMKAKKALRIWNQIPNATKEYYSLELVVMPKNPKYHFLELEIIRNSGGSHFQLDDQEVNEIKESMI